MTQMENRIVLTRFKDGYGPVGAYFLHLKTYTQNAYGQDYEPTWYDSTKALVGDYVDRHPVPTCLRNHALLEEVKAGRGPIRSEEHTSALQSLMRISYAVFCLQKTKIKNKKQHTN